MPNWCSNSITITADKPALDEFLDAFYGSPVVKVYDYHNKSYEDVAKPEGYYFWNIVRPDASILDEYFYNQNTTYGEAAFTGNNWYDWNIRNWGTKWDLSRDSTIANRVDDNTFELLCDTAWAPPIEFLIKASERFPNVSISIHYEELGMCFAGAMLINSGVVVEESEYVINHEYYIQQHGECMNCYFVADDYGIEQTDLALCEMSEEEVDELANTVNN